ncbi:alpha galactosidase A [Arthrobacter sp. AG258]|uniref:glycoside hydrolase family 27 protein n=1 Tax=Arthrobacter sp. AG258 TaxID=2183899 RepID=UPI001060B6CA|nr:glycoside hydrolase family 27 protein [Arthrobacter sp. AG258]TDT74707.1 alpha galactosidase A [Arthrobacter sp. AG258]
MTLAQTPPRGWNSWDSYGASINEDEFLANAHVLATELLPFGWDTAVVDIQWYEPHAKDSFYRPFVPLEMDEYSRLIPAGVRFPSASGTEGFAPLARKTHELGLKFGIHIMRGIPRQAVHQGTAIEGTDVTARDIAARADICTWNTDMYGIDASKPGAQEYYDSLFRLYASWGVDFVKVDDILLPYHQGEITLIRRAIERCGRPMVLSLSCGPTEVEQAGHLIANAEMWRTTADFWDRWADLHEAFDTCARWAPHAGPGHWPDADMLPLGYIGLRSGDGGIRDRHTRFTRAEQRTLMSLWAIAGSPLMLGSDLTRLDDWTKSLLTNEAVLDVNARGRNAREVTRENNVVIWAANLDDNQVVGVFNLDKEDRTIALDPAIFDIKDLTSAEDLWNGKSALTNAAAAIQVDVPAHGGTLIRIS